MYIKKLNNWTDTDWLIFFQENKIYKDERVRVRKILSSDKSIIEKNFGILKSVGLINGIGPGYFPKIARNILTKLFPIVRYEWHDLLYSIAENEEDRKKADLGLFYYSLKGNEYNLFYIHLIYICYIIVRIFGQFKHNNITYDYKKTYLDNRTIG